MLVLEQAPRDFDMSWDIFAMDTPPGVQSVSEIPDDFRPRSLGSRSAVISKIQQIVPTADFSDPLWGLIDGDDWSIEVNLGKDEDCDGFALHVRGGEAAVGAVASILDGLGIRAIDAQTGEFFVSGPSAIESFRKWTAYRDHVVGRGSAE
jgi:hypothetical protein